MQFVRVDKVVDANTYHHQLIEVVLVVIEIVYQPKKLKYQNFEITGLLKKRIFKFKNVTSRKWGVYFFVIDKKSDWEKNVSTPTPK